MDQTRQFRGSGTKAFTLLEVLVSLVIFGIITLALSLALASALQTQTSIQAHQQQAGTVRTVVNLLTRDIQAAFGSQNNPNALFVANGSVGGGSSSGSLLMLSNLAHRIQADDLIVGAGGSKTATGAQNSSASAAVTQSDWQLVRYDLDSRLGLLRRTVVTAPSAQALQSPPDQGIQSLVAEGVVSLTLRYWDSSQSTWRDSWDYEQQNQTQASPGASGGQTPSSGQPATAAQNQQPAAPASTNTSNGDSVLPAAVEVTLVIRTKNGAPLTYVTAIPVVAAQPQDSGIGTAASTPPAGAPTTGSTGTGTQ